jgi:uncharacterized protein (TIGR03435 family)
MAPAAAFVTAATVAFVTAAAAFGQTPAVRPEFEVASVKPSAALVDGQFSIGVHLDGAIFRCNYFSMRNYIMMAYDVKDYQIVAPDWMATDHFDVVAKLPAGVTGEKQHRAMVQSLLEDRFKLVVHRETKDLPSYALVVGKNGLKVKEVPPDPETDDADKGKVDVTATGGGRGGTVVNYGKGSYVTYSLNKLEAKKVTFASLVDTLGRFVDRPIVDMTGLTGRYDFTLEYSVEELRSLVRASGGDASRIPDLGGDPTISIFSSLEGLGLKLEPRKTSVEVIVVDRAEKTPTAN